MRRSQCDVLLEHLHKHSHITQIEAITLYRIFNLKGRINDLRSRGWFIETRMLKDATGKPYARYSLSTQDKLLLDALSPEDRHSMVIIQSRRYIEEVRKRRAAA